MCNHKFISSSIIPEGGGRTNSVFVHQVWWMVDGSMSPFIADELCKWKSNELFKSGLFFISCNLLPAQSVIHFQFNGTDEETHREW